MEKTNLENTQEFHQQNIDKIIKLYKDFNIKIESTGYVEGNVYTLYKFSIPSGVTYKKIMQYGEDLQLRFSASMPCRIISIQSDICGEFGVEIPNKMQESLMLKDIPFYGKNKKGISIPLGKDINGQYVFNDIEKLSHILIAGQTGSGKSVFLHSMINYIITNYNPDEVRFILIDPKRVEFTEYKNLPHLLCNEIIIDLERAKDILENLNIEMVRRFHLFANLKTGAVPDIITYNDVAKKEGLEILPHIIVVIDEFADLIETSKMFEILVGCIAEKAQCAGISFIISTQRPSVDVITSKIKVNFPTRIAFRTSSKFDSQTILKGEFGAEKLVAGEILFQWRDQNLLRLQRPLITRNEIEENVKKAVKTYKQNYNNYFNHILKTYKVIKGIECINENSKLILILSKPFLLKKQYIVKVKKGQIAIIYVEDKPFLRYTNEGEYDLFAVSEMIGKIIKVVIFNESSEHFKSISGFGNVKLQIPNYTTEIRCGATFEFSCNIKDVIKLVNYFYRQEKIISDDITSALLTSSKNSLISITQNLFSELGKDLLLNHIEDKYFRWIENYYRLNPILDNMGVEIIGFKGTGFHIPEEDLKLLQEEMQSKKSANAEINVVGQNICNICGASYEYRNGKWVCPACGSYKIEQTLNDESTANSRYIFISYSHKDSNDVLPMIRELEQKYNIWYDEGIDPGTEWDENIAKHVEECDFFIACMTKNYIESSNCKDELNYARDLNKKRLIVYFENVELPSGMKMRLNRLQNIHKYTYKSDNDFYGKLSQSEGIAICIKSTTTASSRNANAHLENKIMEEKVNFFISEVKKVEDNLFIQALEFAVKSESVSITMLQRHFQIGYARAGAIIDKMEQMGFVSKFNGSAARKVLLAEEDFNKIKNDTAGISQKKKEIAKKEIGQLVSNEELDTLLNDKLFMQALEFAVKTKKVSISMLQGHFEMAYGQASMIVDKMEQLGFVSVANGSKAREVLLSEDEFNKVFKQDDK